MAFAQLWQLGTANCTVALRWTRQKSAPRDLNLRPSCVPLGAGAKGTKNLAAASGHYKPVSVLSCQSRRAALQGGGEVRAPPVRSILRYG